MQTLSTLFVYSVALSVLASTADMGTLQLMVTAALGLGVGSGAQWVSDNR
jgi:hypothetical protein